jgi:hypothetical protein
MYDKIFKENKLVAFYSLSIALLLFVAVLVAGSRTTVDTSAREGSNLTPGCYYRLSCPPRTQNDRQSVFRCLPSLVCPTPTRPPAPTVSRTILTCNDCRSGRFTGLCFDSVRKSSYCYNFSPNITGFPSNVNCVQCTAPTPSVCTPMPIECRFPTSGVACSPPPGGWCRSTPTPTAARPTRLPTLPPTTPTCFIADCAAPPPGCRYVGGDSCTTCGDLVCEVTADPQ